MTNPTTDESRAPRSSFPTHEQLRKRLEGLDLNGDGRLSVAEQRAAVADYVNGVHKGQSMLPFNLNGMHFTPEQILHVNHIMEAGITREFGNVFPQGIEPMTLADAQRIAPILNSVGRSGRAPVRP